MATGGFWYLRIQWELNGQMWGMAASSSCLDQWCLNIAVELIGIRIFVLCINFRQTSSSPGNSFWIIVVMWMWWRTMEENPSCACGQHCLQRASLPDWSLLSLPVPKHRLSVVLGHYRGSSVLPWQGQGSVKFCACIHCTGAKGSL